ncbi:MAG: flagellar assembly protein FliW [Planctomycetota bacterium]|nr:flagellar assembly protein FliW [Planctomycetota bacterium]
MSREIETTRFGRVEIDEETIIRFPDGLLGFGQVQEYVIIDHPGPMGVQWLQALDVPELAFVVIDPLLFKSDYLVQLHAQEMERIGLDDLAKGKVMVILVVPKDPRKITANLQGPLVLNPEKRLGMQVVLPHDRYTTKHLVFGEDGDMERRAHGNA